MDTTGRTPPAWRRRTATSAYQMSIVCDLVALLTTVDGPAELVLRGTALGLRTLARALESPPIPDRRAPSG